MDWIPFDIPFNPAMIAGSCLWSLGFYLGSVKVKNWLIEQLQRWFNFAERSLYTSEEEFEKTRLARESQNLFYASLFSIIPFLMFGTLCNLLIDITLGKSWGISLGILLTMLAGIYALGRADSGYSS